MVRSALLRVSLGEVFELKLLLATILAAGTERIEVINAGLLELVESRGERGHRVERTGRREVI